MKKIYETFAEIASDVTRGDLWPHGLASHEEDHCVAWQKGVEAFARFLDGWGLKLADNPEIYRKLWDDRGDLDASDAIDAPKEGPDDEVAALTARVEAMRSAGGQLADCASYIAQRQGGLLPDRDCEVLKTCQVAWDAALAPKEEQA